MKITLFLTFFALAMGGFAQNSVESLQLFIKDANGRYIDLKPVTGIEGSPFFFEKYTPARLTLGKNKYYIKAKLQLVENQVYFENEGKEMISTLNVDKIEFYDDNTSQYNLAFRNGFPALGKNTEQTYYHVIDSGKATLLKHFGVRVRETRPYNSATNVTIYEKDKSNYVFVNNNIVVVKKLSEVVEALSDKKSQVEEYIASKKIKISKEEDLKSLIAFYNKL